ncbi:MAG: 16S rRNA (cytosine(1402)-N(4))-methyltransferase [Planctomyces sp.]|nr:16S rRNA (cytosine(1402)-N(4))-methyltransferase [Planctomyces sp.]
MTQSTGPVDQGPAFHLPVLLAETLERLLVHPGGVYVDATLGEGGHTSALLQASTPVGRVMGIDRDPRSLARAADRLERFGDRFIPLHGNYTQMVAMANQHRFDRVDGILMDLGLSSRQLDTPGYGFSFQTDEPLDMRFDPNGPLSADDVVNNYSEEDLANVIFEYGEEPRSRRIARSIVRNRPVNSTGQLASLVASAMGPAPRQGRRVHPATRTFQALRIEVNDELTNVEAGLSAAIELLAPSGRLAVISYHSLEDRIVKTFLQRESAGCICPPGFPVCVCEHEPTVNLVNRRIIKPTPEEVAGNPRSRSARMRVAERR